MSDIVRYVCIAAVALAMIASVYSCTVEAC